jgi:predicted O-methyltransferase YrrM
MGKSKSTIIGGMESSSQKLADEILEEILSSGKVEDVAGNVYTLEANIDMEESRFLGNLIRENNYTTSFEIGCAYGISSLSICSSLPENDGFHSIIDPFQFNEWKGIGIRNLEKAGLKNFKLVEKPSEIALPDLVAAGAKFDFAFIDGWHTFDHTLLDMFYANRLLRKGGIMVIDDVGMKGVQKAVNYFLNYPAYKFEGGVALSNTAKRNTFSKVIVKPLKHLAKLVPAKVSEEIFSPNITKKTIEGYSMVALRKFKEDERPWNWYETF